MNCTTVSKANPQKYNHGVACFCVCFFLETTANMITASVTVTKSWIAGEFWRCWCWEGVIVGDVAGVGVAVGLAVGVGVSVGFAVGVGVGAGDEWT